MAPRRDWYPTCAVADVHIVGGYLAAVHSAAAMIARAASKGGGEAARSTPARLGTSFIFSIERRIYDSLVELSEEWLALYVMSCATECVPRRRAAAKNWPRVESSRR